MDLKQPETTKPVVGTWDLASGEIKNILSTVIVHRRYVGICEDILLTELECVGSVKTANALKRIIQSSCVVVKYHTTSKNILKKEMECICGVAYAS
jgi:hypothetical protein